MTDYSRGDYADLPAGKTDLENNYTAPDLTAIASNDNSTYAEQTANNEIAIHQYKKTVTGQYTNITWSGKSSLAPSESPVIMEVYNVDLTDWEELDRDDSTAADTDFDIIYNNLATADYLDAGVITWRVYQAASGGPAPGTYYIGEGTHDVTEIPCDFIGIIDTMLSEQYSTDNYGSYSTMRVSQSDPGHYANVLIAVPGLSNLAGKTVTDAVLYLVIDTGVAVGETITLRRLLVPWEELQATWERRVTATTWGTYGAIGNGDRDNTRASGTITIPALPTEGQVTCTGANLIEDVQDMIDDPNNNFGWILQKEGADNAQFLLLASSQSSSMNRPYLMVTIS